MKTFISILTLLITTNSYAQKKHPLTYDSADVICRFINFSVVDTVDYWKYELNLSYRGFKDDSLKPPIGSIVIFRSKPLAGPVYDANPYIRFSIYSIMDSVTAKMFSQRIRLFSSCGGPTYGGELLVVGNFIFVNSSVCTYCLTSKNDDVCRPLVDYIFSKSKLLAPTSIDEFVNHLEIKKGLSNIKFLN